MNTDKELCEFCGEYTSEEMFSGHLYCNNKSCSKHVDVLNSHDNINNPKHYKQQRIETIDYIEDMGYVEGNVIKYVSRYKYKNGIEDLKKARWYLDRLIKKLEDAE